MNGVELIAAERKRQIDEEGWTPEHDNAHGAHEMAAAARCYALCSYPHYTRIMGGATPGEWPWPREWWKPSADPIRNLVKAGALIAAEIDRLQRKELEGR